MFCQNAAWLHWIMDKLDLIRWSAVFACFRRNLEMAIVMICEQFFESANRFDGPTVCSRCSRQMYFGRHTVCCLLQKPAHSDPKEKRLTGSVAQRVRSRVGFGDGRERSTVWASALPVQLPECWCSASLRYSQKHWSCQPLASCECFSLPRRRQAGMTMGCRMEACSLVVECC